ncbi:unnamed protein product [Cunninghamella blakesleeana]
MFSVVSSIKKPNNNDYGLNEIIMEITAIIKYYGVQITKSDQEHLMKYRTVRYYLTLLQDNKLEKVDCSMKAAKDIVLLDDTEKTSYIATAIRNWANRFIEDGYIKESMQGRFTKHISVLSNEDIKQECIHWLYSTKINNRDIFELQKYIESLLEKKRLDVKTVELSTICSYLPTWRTSYKKKLKIYITMGMKGIMLSNVASDFVKE